MKKIQFGCGSNTLDGWENHDSDVDITKPLPYADAVFEIVFAEHVCEHIGSHEFLRFCEECHRILEPGGVLRLCMPVLERLEPAHGRDIILGHGHLASYTTNLIEHILRIAGFKDIRETWRIEIDSHWKVIGKEKDDLETARIEGIKP